MEMLNLVRKSNALGHREFAHRPTECKNHNAAVEGKGSKVDCKLTGLVRWTVFILESAERRVRRNCLQLTPRDWQHLSNYLLNKQ